ncbi:MAG: LamG-like jellyroll fold domain-containing protein [Planctomycetota bacterium]
MKKKISIVLVLVLGLVTEVTNADFVWGTAVNLGPNVNSSSNDAGPSVSADGLTLYFSSNRSGGEGGYDLWCTKRTTINDDWGPAVNLGRPPNLQYSYWEPSISSDELTLYFSDGHSPQFGGGLPAGLGGQGDIWMAIRASVNDVWGEPINLGPAVNSQHAIHPSISSDSLSLYFQTHRSGALGHCDIMVATRKSISDPFGDPVFLKNINTGGPEWTPDISADGLTLFFMRNPGPTEIWVSRRWSTDDDFGAPIKLPHQVNVPGYDNGIPNLSADGSTLYFLSSRPGGFGNWDLWQVPITPIVDFNGDGIIDVKDVVIMTEHWGENYSLCDIGPMPWGDGVVDVQDLVVLTEYIEPIDRTLIAHWALDEAEGIVAGDSVGNNDGYVMGDPVWAPDGGQVDGAIYLDGIDDVIIAGPVLNPAHGVFSVVAWIKGGAPGQTVISQEGGANWLSTDPLEGYLMTEVKGPGRASSPLLSRTVITDGLWHRIGLVWDGLHRTLYVDDVAVAEDIQDGLIGSDNGLCIGTGKNMEPGTYFSGLIDDIRIYNVALTAEQIAMLAQ